MKEREREGGGAERVGTVGKGTLHGWLEERARKT